MNIVEIWSKGHLIQSLDPNLPMPETRTYEDLYRYHAMEGPGVAIETVGIMGVVGLILAIAGLYGGVRREPQDPRNRHSDLLSALTASMWHA